MAADAAPRHGLRIAAIVLGAFTLRVAVSLYLGIGAAPTSDDRDYDQLARVTTLVKDVAVRVADLDHRVVVDKKKPDPKGQCVQ